MTQNESNFATPRVVKMSAGVGACRGGAEGVADTFAILVNLVNVFNAYR